VRVTRVCAWLCDCMCQEQVAGPQEPGPTPELRARSQVWQKQSDAILQDDRMKKVPVPNPNLNHNPDPTLTLTGAGTVR
jgi:hypothetical protein